ncbi:MAG: hypothetical protein KQA33_03185, partial [Candidatus Aenigmarchaeota archaeon]|nr:hypothetical protein [Candidatus Aenigmarchaeota archaeon]
MENVKVEPILEVPKPETEVEIPGPLYDNFNKAFGWLKADQNPAPRSGTVMDVTYVGTTYVTRPKSVTQIQS